MRDEHASKHIIYFISLLFVGGYDTFYRDFTDNKDNYIGDCISGRCETTLKLSKFFDEGNGGLGV